jgi:hypothetical protein
MILPATYPTTDSTCDRMCKAFASHKNGSMSLMTSLATGDKLSENWILSLIAGVGGTRKLHSDFIPTT